MEYSTRGNHITADLWGISPEVLNNLEQLLEWMEEAIAAAGATVLGDLSHQFRPHGVTALLLLSESHMSIHTYPEKGFIALDIYTCGDHVDPMKGIAYMADKLQPQHSLLKYIERGVDPSEW